MVLDSQALGSTTHNAHPQHSLGRSLGGAALHTSWPPGPASAGSSSVWAAEKRLKTNHDRNQRYEDEGVVVLMLTEHPSMPGTVLTA